MQDGRKATSTLSELERGLKKRGVRVKERRRLLRALAKDPSGDALAEQRDALLEAVRQAARELRAELG